MSGFGYLLRAFSGYPLPVGIGGLVLAFGIAWVIAGILGREREDGRLTEATIRRLRREGW